MDLFFFFFFREGGVGWGGGGDAPCYTVYENIKNNTKKAYKYIKTIAVSTLKINGDFFYPPPPFFLVVTLYFAPGH